MRDVFEIDALKDVVFETTDLAGCSDIGPVEVREPSWAGISPVLPKLFVRTVQREIPTGTRVIRTYVLI